MSISYTYICNTYVYIYIYIYICPLAGKRLHYYGVLTRIMVFVYRILCGYKIDIPSGKGDKKLWKDPPLFTGKTHKLSMANFNGYFDITRG